MPDAQHDARAPSSQRRWWIGGGICIAVLGATVLAALISLRRDLSPIECVKLEQLKSVAIAHLENGRYQQKRENGQGELRRAEAGFEELSQKLPGDPLGPRNLAVTRLLELREKLTSAASALEAADLMLRLESKSASAHMLAAQIALEAGDQPRAVAELARAAELAPNDAAVWYAVSRLWQGSEDEAEKQRGYEALGRAFDAQPGNLFLLASWLAAQARRRDPQLSETLQTLRETLNRHPVLIEQLQRGGRIADPLSAVDRALRAVEQQHWEQAAESLTLAETLRAASWTLSDERQIDQDPLVLLRHEFRVPCRDRIAVAEPEPIEVNFNEFPVSLQLPPLLGVVDVRLADFDLDGRLDVVVLRETVLEIYGRPRQQEDWRRIAASPLPPGFSSVLPADLNDDARSLSVGDSDSEPVQDSAEAAAKSCRSSELELLVFGEAGLAVLRGRPSEDGRSRSLEFEVPKAFANLKAVSAATVVDFDQDGDLDLAATGGNGLSLWANRGNLEFDPVNTASELPPADVYASALASVDWDRDFDLDLILAGPGGKPAGWLENLRHGQFRWRPFADEFSSLTGAESIAVLDCDGNDSWALAVGGEAGLSVMRTEPGRQGPPAERATSLLTNAARNGVQVWDYDNDGRLDLLSWNDATIDVYRGAAGQFVAAPQLLARAGKTIRGCDTGDLDGDGDLDLAIAEADRIVLYDNQGGNQNHWLQVELLAAADRPGRGGCVNSYGIGSTIELRTGAFCQRRLVQSGVTHFGLGRRETPDAAQHRLDQRRRARHHSTGRRSDPLRSATCRRDSARKGCLDGRGLPPAAATAKAACEGARRASRLQVVICSEAGSATACQSSERMETGRASRPSGNQSTMAESNNCCAAGSVLSASNLACNREARGCPSGQRTAAIVAASAQSSYSRPRVTPFCLANVRTARFGRSRRLRATSQC